MYCPHAPVVPCRLAQRTIVEVGAVYTLLKMLLAYAPCSVSGRIRGGAVGAPGPIPAGSTASTVIGLQIGASANLLPTVGIELYRTVT